MYQLALLLALPAIISTTNSTLSGDLPSKPLAMNNEMVYCPPTHGEHPMKVLTLSHNYEPIGVINWQKAVGLLFSGKVLVLAESGNKIRSPSTTLNIPSVIVFKNTKGRRVKSTRFSRKNVWIRDEGKCQYCAKSVSVSSYTLDHIQPKTRGGTTAWTNVVTCCYSCNQKKGDLSLQQAGMKLLKPAIKPAALPYIHNVEFYHLNASQVPEEWKFWLGESE